MQKVPSATSGFSVIEAIVATFIIGILAAALGGAILFGMRAVQSSGNRQRAVYLAEEGLEAVRNIRDAGFTNLVDGTYGLQISGGVWNLVNTSDTTDIFTRQIAISSVDSVTKMVTATVSWQQNGPRTESTSQITYLGNTTALNSQASSLVVNTSGASIGGGGTKELNGITLSNPSSKVLTIDKITVSWTNTSRLIQTIQINGSNVWTSTGIGTPTGNQPSGTTLNITNVSLAANATNIPINRFQFNGNMSGNVFTITFTMSDGSAKTVTYP